MGNWGIKTGVLALCLLSCGGGNGSETDTDPDSPTCSPFDLGTSNTRVSLNPSPAFNGDAPIFVFNTRHTEDPFNLNLIAELYNEVLHVLERLQADFPDLHPVWTLQFQGADANAMESSNNLAVKLAFNQLKTAYSNDLIRFGYHGQHEPTYINRPTSELDESSSWAEVVTAVKTYLTCKKSDSFTGNCDAPSGGGIEAVESLLGPVDIVSGISTPHDAAQFETPGGHHAVLSVLPDRMLGLGFSDHAPSGVDHQDTINELMERMTVGGSADGALLWWDNSLRIHASDTPNISKGSLKYRESNANFTAKWEALNRDRPHVILAHLAGKYIYVKEGESPTQYGYEKIAAGESPQLPQIGPDALVLTKTERDTQYKNIAQNMTYITTQLNNVAGSQFVDADEVIERVAPEDYWMIDSEEATAIARWIYQEWSADGVPPDFVTDGTEYYSLRDALGVLVGAQVDTGDAELLRLYGPLISEDSDTTGCLPLYELQSLAMSLHDQLSTAQDAAWTTTPQTLLPGSFRTSIGTLNLAQFLRALAAAHIASVEGFTGDGVQVEPAKAAPETASLVETLGSLNAIDTSWSLKPARIRTGPAE